MKVIIKGKTLKGSPAYIRKYLLGVKTPWGEIKVIDNDIVETSFVSTLDDKYSFISSLEGKQEEYVINKMVSSRKGAYTKLVYLTPLKGEKFRVTSTVVRLGINYGKMKKLDKSEISVSPLPWGTWDEKHPGYLINHKGNKYLRCYLSFNKRLKKKESYFDSTLELLEKTEELEKENKGHPDKTFTLNINNILSLGRE